MSYTNTFLQFYDNAKPFLSFFHSEIADNPYLNSLPSNAFQGLCNDSLILYVILP